jgi:hypothetical protein
MTKFLIAVVLLVCGFSMPGMLWLFVIAALIVVFS